jgi:hypothetical protein
MRKDYGKLTNAVLDALKEYGPMTTSEVSDCLNRPKGDISATLTRMTKAFPLTPKRIYIKMYVYDEEGARRYPRAVYDLGDQEDAKKPKSNPKEIKRRYEAKRKGMYIKNSVFNLGLTRDQVREKLRGVA